MQDLSQVNWLADKIATSLCLACLMRRKPPLQTFEENPSGGRAESQKLMFPVGRGTIVPQSQMFPVGRGTTVPQSQRFVQGPCGGRFLVMPLGVSH